MDYKFLQLSTYTTPEIKEVSNQDWIGYGADNDYFQFLIDRYNGSATNNAIINGISAMIVGKFLDATDSSQKPEEYAQMKSLISESMQQKLASDLKLMGQCAMQVIYSQDHSRIAQVEHIPVETLRAEKCNEEGEIPAYYYYYDWSEYKQGDYLERLPVFGTSKQEIEVLYIKPYRAGFKYYSPVDYQGGIQYCELEEEIANYHLNNIMNGLAPSMLLNFNNGTPTEEERNIIEQKIAAKYQGTSNAGRFILAFNDSADSAATMETVQLSDAPQQYEFLSTESMKKIMVAHRVTSPILFGIKDMTGFGNNAEEIVTASTLMDNTVIRPFQQLLLNAFDDILAYNKIVLNLYFKTLQPLEFNDLTNATNKEQIEEETGQKFSLSKVIDGKFPDYRKVVPTNNNKSLIVSTKEFIDSVERVITVSTDRKEGVKLVITKNSIKLSVNSTNSGEGNEVIKANYSDEELTISFNSKYLIDIASEIEDKNIKMNFKDSISPVMIEDQADKNSYYVIMPMKI